MPAARPAAAQRTPRSGPAIPLGNLVAGADGELPENTAVGTRYAVSARLEGLPLGDPGDDSAAQVELMAARQVALPALGR